MAPDERSRADYGNHWKHSMIRVVARYSGGEEELGIDESGNMFHRWHHGLGRTAWKYFESGDTPLGDARAEIVRLSLKLREVAE